MARGHVCFVRCFHSQASLGRVPPSYGQIPGRSGLHRHHVLTICCVCYVPKRPRKVGADFACNSFQSIIHIEKRFSTPPGVPLHRIARMQSHIASRTRRGGQSAPRFSRSRQLEELEFLRKVAARAAQALEHMLQAFSKCGHHSKIGVWHRVTMYSTYNKCKNIYIYIYNNMTTRQLQTSIRELETFSETCLRNSATFMVLSSVDVLGWNTSWSQSCPHPYDEGFRAL